MLSTLRFIFFVKSKISLNIFPIKRFLDDSQAVNYG